MSTSHRRIASALFWVFVLQLSALAAVAQTALPKARRESYYGIFFLGNRIGGSTIVETPESFRGKKALKVESRSKIRIAALGEVEQNVDLVQYVDEKWMPLHLRFNMTSAGHTAKVVAEFFPDRVECELDSQGTRSKKTIPVPKGVSLVADPDLLGDRKLKVGEKRQFHLFEPLTLQILPLDVQVLREEKLTVGGKSYLATVLKTVNSMTGEGTQWLTEDGRLLQGDSALGIRIVREESPGPATEPKSPQVAYTPPVDLAVATAIKTEKQIEEPRETRYLRVRIAGIPERRLVLSDARQRVQVETNGAAPGPSLTAIYEVNADPGSQVSKPGENPRGKLSEERTRYLKAAPYLEVSDPRIRQQARQVVGKETDPGRKAEKIRAWIHGRMKADPTIGVPRSATDVLKTPEGVCRDYAVLFAAMARAAGVPTRICSGIVYFKGSFFYHAWNECLVDPARGQWRAFDATLPTDFVDATHIKFAQGDPTEMFQAIRVVGQLKAEILEYR